MLGIVECVKELERRTPLRSGFAAWADEVAVEVSHSRDIHPIIRIIEALPTVCVLHFIFPMGRVQNTNLGARSPFASIVVISHPITAKIEG